MLISKLVIRGRVALTFARSPLSEAVTGVLQKSCRCFCLFLHKDLNFSSGPFFSRTRGILHITCALHTSITRRRIRSRLSQGFRNAGSKEHAQT